MKIHKFILNIKKIRILVTSNMAGIDNGVDEAVE